MNIEQYKQANGFYDTERMMIDAGVNSRTAAFDSIFGDVQGTPAMPPEWTAAIEQAKAHNDALMAEIAAAHKNEAQALMTDDEPWPQATWKRLHDLGFAWYATGSATAEYGWSAGLNDDGERLLSGHVRTAPGDYADQAGIDDA